MDCISVGHGLWVVEDAGDGADSLGEFLLAVCLKRFVHLPDQVMGLFELDIERQRLDVDSNDHDYALR